MDYINDNLSTLIAIQRQTDVHLSLMQPVIELVKTAQNEEPTWMITFRVYMQNAFLNMAHYHELVQVMSIVQLQEFPL